MTGQELLASVKRLFQVMYLEQSTLDALLLQTLRTYQGKAGPTADAYFPDDATEMATPADFGSVAVAVDASGRYVEVRREKTSDSDKLKAVSAVPVSAAPRTYGSFYGAGIVSQSLLKKPVNLTYFVRLSADGEIPFEAEALLFKHLKAAIEVPNTKRAKDVAMMTGAQLDFPDEEQLKQDLLAIEEEFEEAKSIIPPVAVF